MQMTQFLLLLHSVPGMGEKTLGHILRYMAQRKLSPKETLLLPERAWRKDLCLPAPACVYLFQHREELLKSSAEQERLRRRNDLHLLYLGSAAYPEALETHEALPPPILYARGNLALAEERRNFTFAVMTSNKPTPHHLARLNERVTALSEAGGTVVTGHDRLPYQRAALAAHRLSRPIIYVFDRGLREAMGPNFDRTPFAAARIHEVEFNTDVDLALSPFRLDDHALSMNLKRRDQIVFSLADVILAQDIRAEGVMYAECLRVLEQNRPLYVAEDGREGNALLREKGAKPIPAGERWAERLMEDLVLG
jgi:predicted Rossmann fold nucleotide-binding protein DprA/Smf involved in DNA uptake